jgi:hypothetical protein
MLGQHATKNVKILNYAWYDRALWKPGMPEYHGIWRNTPLTILYYQAFIQKSNAKIKAKMFKFLFISGKNSRLNLNQ